MSSATKASEMPQNAVIFETRPPKKPMISADHTKADRNSQQQPQQNNHDSMDIDTTDRLQTKPAVSSGSTKKKNKYVHPKPYSEILGYRFLETLGQGSMGKVKLAEHRETKEIVAVKIIPKYPKEWTSRPRKRSSRQAEEDGIPADIEYDPSRDLRIFREAFTLKLLDNPLIVKCIDFVITEHHYYLVFEYVKGKPLLDHIMKNGRMREEKARSILQQIIAAVDYCHRNSIVHRDLKIENIMIDESPKLSPAQASLRSHSGKKPPSGPPKIKVLDFGLSNFYQKDRLLSTCCGSLYFAAPELLHAQKYIGPEVDIWSIGVIAYVLVCGQVPFDDSNLHMLHAKIKSGKVSYPQYLSPACVKFLKRLLCVNPKLRATMDEVKSNPWFQGSSAVAGSENTISFGEPPYLLSSLGDKFRYLTFGAQSAGAPIPPASTDLLKNASAIARVPMKQLPGHHPNPVITSILKRDPFASTELTDPKNYSMIMYTNSQGESLRFSPRMSTFGVERKDARRNIHLSEPTSFGFGFDAQEVDDALKRALKTGGVPRTPIISFYYLLHEWMQKYAGKPVPVRNPSSLPAASQVTPSRQASGPVLDSVPQPSDLYGSIYPKQITERALYSSGPRIRALMGPWSSKAPQELCQQFYDLLGEEGLTCLMSTGECQSANQRPGFSSEWMWKPSFIPNAGVETQELRSVHFYIEWVEVLSGEKRQGFSRYALRWAGKSGDSELLERVWERVQWRWHQWISVISHSI